MAINLHYQYSHDDLLPVYGRFTCNVGRSKVDVDIEDIMALKSLNYGWTKIASILGISRSTLYRRLNDEGISCDLYTPLTSAELDEIVIDIKRNHPNDGEVRFNAVCYSTPDR